MLTQSSWTENMTKLKKINTLTISKLFSLKKRLQLSFHLFFSCLKVFRNPSPIFWKGFFILCDLATGVILEDVPNEEICDLALISEEHTVALTPFLLNCDSKSGEEPVPKMEHS